MQKKRWTGNELLNKLHRGAVYTCIGVTLYGTFLLGCRGYHYFTVIRPEKKMMELQMLEEGKHGKGADE